MNDLFIDNLAILAAYALPILSVLCLGAFIGDKVMDYQDAAVKRCKYGLVRVGSALKPSAKKCKFNVIVRTALAKLRFN